MQPRCLRLDQLKVPIQPGCDDAVRLGHIMAGGQTAQIWHPSGQDFDNQEKCERKQHRQFAADVTRGTA